MASIAMQKLKSKLTTRNQFTGKAMDRMTKENLRELFQGDLNYMSWEKTYLQRRFHPDEYLKQLREHRRELFDKQRENAPNSEIDYDKLLQEEEKHDIELQKRFKQFSETHNGEKPVLILDVDNTMVYVRFFSEEMQINDIVTYFASESVTKNNGKVIEIRLTLSLDISNNTLIDKIGSERMICNYWAANNEVLKKYKKKNGVFDYALDDSDEIIQCKIRKVEVTGCRIEVNNNNLSEDEDGYIYGEYEIDFTNGNENLSKLEPMLERPGMSAVDFIYEGFLIRLRPNLDEFLEYCADDYDVVIYTSANKLIYEGMLQVLHEYVKDQLGREDEEDLLLWSDVLYRDDCTLDYNERGKPYHHKDLTLFGCDLSRVIMIDNSPIVCRGEEPNFLLIKDYFGKDNMDDELMEVYQMLDAMVEISGDVRYFLCGLDSEQTEELDVSTEDQCWEYTETLMKELDAYYSEQIALSPETSVGYVTEEEEAYMDDYDEEDIPDREKMYSMHSNKIPSNINDSIIKDNIDKKDEEEYDTVTTATTDNENENENENTNTRVMHSAHTSNVVTPKENKTPKTPQDMPTHAYTEPNTPNQTHVTNDSSISTITITDADDRARDTNKARAVKFAAPSINTNAPRDASLSLSNRTQSAKSSKFREYTAGRYKKSLSARYKKGTNGVFSQGSNGSNSMKEHLKRNKSLLLDPQKLELVTKRHARYSSMSPRYLLSVDALGSNGKNTKGIKPKLSFNDLSLNDAIHSFGAVDTDDEDDDDDRTFFTAKQMHEHTKSSLTIDSKRYSLQTKTSQKVPVFKADVHVAANGNGNVNAMITAQSADDAKMNMNTMKIMHMGKSNVPNMAMDDNKNNNISDMKLTEDEIIPPPNFNKRKSMKTVDEIKAAKHAKKQKRLSAKRNSSFKLHLTPINKYMNDRSDKRKKGTHHRRGLSSDAIGQIDFDMEKNDDTFDTFKKIKPGKKKHKMSIQDTQTFGKVWRNTINTMAPRPTAQKIVTSSKHDEFILLFQQQLNEIKEEQIKQYKRKQGHVNSMEKRKSVPDFAMLSEIDSETDIIAHKLRLSTLREDQISNLTFSKTATLESVNEKQSIDKKKMSDTDPESKQKLLANDGNKMDGADIKLIDDWDTNISTKHGCCYYFCCCCICNIFHGGKHSNSGAPKNNPISYSP